MEVLLLYQILFWR